VRQRGTSIAIPCTALLLFAAVAGTFKLRAYDLFWHLASGRWILEHRQLPGTDPFRFTSESASWVNHEWLFQIFARWVESLAGLDGLVILRAVVVVSLAAVLLHAMGRSGASAPAAAVIAAAAILLARPRFMLRPELFSLVALASLLTLLQEYRRSHSRSGMAGSALLVGVWANVHPAAIIAPVIAVAFLFGGYLLGGSQPERGRVDGVSPVTLPVVLGAAVMANPVGWKLYLVPFEIRAALGDLPAVNPEWLSAWAAPQPALIGGVVALSALVGLAALRTGRIDAATALSTLALGTLAASGVRHQGLFFVGAAFLAGESVADLARKPRPVPLISRRFATVLAAAFCAVAAAWCIWTPPEGLLRARQGPYSFGLGLEPGRFPVAAVDALELRPETGHLYNDVAFGGYLVWRLAPRRVFIDGRNEVNPELLRELAHARSDSRAWSQVLERYAIERALVRYDPRLIEVTDPQGNVVSRRTPNALLFPSDSFALVYWDDVAMLFVRRTAENQERLAAEEYRFVHPEDRIATFQAAAADPAYAASALDELDRRLRADPGCDRALALRSELEALRASAAMR
jgi:hypothetical protein